MFVVRNGKGIIMKEGGTRGKICDFRLNGKRLRMFRMCKCIFMCVNVFLCILWLCFIYVLLILSEWTDFLFALKTRVISWKGDLTKNLICVYHFWQSFMQFRWSEEMGKPIGNVKAFISRIYLEAFEFLFLDRRIRLDW